MNAAKNVRARLEKHQDERENFFLFVKEERVSTRTLARAAGVHPRTWARWEAGESEMPTHTVSHMRRVLHGLEDPT